jgi:hypothetical protein
MLFLKLRKNAQGQSKEENTIQKDSRLTRKLLKEIKPSDLDVESIEVLARTLDNDRDIAIVVQALVKYAVSNGNYWRNFTGRPAQNDFCADENKPRFSLGYAKCLNKGYIAAAKDNNLFTITDSLLSKLSGK